MKKLLKFFSFSIITLVVLGLLSGFVCTSERKDTLHIRGFFCEPKDTIDVIAIGASEVYTSFNSPLLWKEFGFTSYAVSYAGAPGSLYPVMLAEALKYQKPKLVAVEINGFLHGDKYLEETAKMHTWYDNVPFSKDKFRQIKDSVPKHKIGEFIFPIIKYHDNWKHPKICYDSIVGKLKLKKCGISYTKNFATTTQKRNTSDFNYFEPQFTEKSQNYLTQFLDECKARGLKNVLFFRSPHCLTDTNPDTVKKIGGLIESYGYQFANFENSLKDMNLDAMHDFYNNDHVNIYGMEKTTGYIGQYIVDNYDVMSEHSKEDIDRWNECSEKMDSIILSAKQDIENNKCRDYYEMSAL